MDDTIPERFVDSLKHPLLASSSTEEAPGPLTVGGESGQDRAATDQVSLPALPTNIGQPGSTHAPTLAGQLQMTDMRGYSEVIADLTADGRLWRPGTADVLHVGCGAHAEEKLPAVFRQTGWREIRLDIDPEVSPDFVASITDMHVISDRAVDAVYSSHNIEHLYPHEVSLALQEMHRVLRAGGFAFIKLPDLQEVARHVADGRLEDPLYMSPMGPIAPLDILYGHRPSLAAGNAFMAHRTGFTGETLGNALIKAGFAAVMIQRNPPVFDLTAIAFRTSPDKDQVMKAQAKMLPDPDRPAVLYTATG
jgi:hypothetical protein